MAFPFIVRQIENPARVIILQGRSLPYQGVAWGGTMELDVSWFPGNPVASVQVIGPREKSTTIVGKWKDLFLASRQNHGVLANFPPLTRASRPDATVRGGTTFKSAGSVPSDFAERARVLRDAFRLLRKEGGLVQVEWGSIVRFGFVKETTFTHDREEDIDYEITFEFLGDTPSQPKPLLPQIELLSLLKALLALLDALINTLLSAIFAAQQWLTRINQFINKIGSFITELLDAISKLGDFAFAPANVLGNIRRQLTAIRLAARDLFANLDNQRSAAVEAAFLGNPAAVALNNLLQQRVRANVQEIAAEAARQANLISQMSSPALLGTITMPGGTTLRDVARRFFGNPDDWRVIAEFNGFGGSIVPRGTIVRIPRV